MSNINIMMKNQEKFGKVYSYPNLQVIFLRPGSGLCQTSNVSLTEFGFEEITDDGELN